MALAGWIRLPQVLGHETHGVPALGAHVPAVQRLSLSVQPAGGDDLRLQQDRPGSLVHGDAPEEGRKLTGRVEIDDSYLGGEVHGAKAGRGSPNKVPFVAAVETTEAGQAKFICLSPRPFTSEAIRDFASRSLGAPATMISDGLGCFKVVAGMGIVHDPHVTGGGAASAQHPSFMAINTVLGNLKTAFSGTYHAFGFRKYASRYLGQVQFLFNHRYDLRAILTQIVKAACASSARPLRLLRAAELSC